MGIWLGLGKLATAMKEGREQEYQQRREMKKYLFDVFGKLSESPHVTDAGRNEMTKKLLQTVVIDEADPKSMKEFQKLLETPLTTIAPEGTPVPVPGTPAEGGVPSTLPGLPEMPLGPRAQGAVEAEQPRIQEMLRSLGVELPQVPMATGAIPPTEMVGPPTTAGLPFMAPGAGGEQPIFKSQLQEQVEDLERKGQELGLATQAIIEQAGGKAAATFPYEAQLKMLGMGPPDMTQWEQTVNSISLREFDVPYNQATPEQQGEARRLAQEEGREPTDLEKYKQLQESMLGRPLTEREEIDMMESWKTLGTVTSFNLSNPPIDPNDVAYYAQQVANDFKNFGLIKNKRMQNAVMEELAKQGYDVNQIDSSVRTAAQFSRAALTHIDDAKEMIQAQSANLGPVYSRWRNFLTGTIGEGEKDLEEQFKKFAPLRTNLALVRSALARVHGGARGGGSIAMLEYFNRYVMNTDIMDSDLLLSVLDVVGDWLDKYKDMAPLYSESVGVPNVPDMGDVENWDWVDGKLQRVD